MGRPTNLTPELSAAIIALIQHAVPPAVAAGAMGVATSTFYEWMGRGEKEDTLRPADPLYIAFAENVRKAEYEAESALVGLAIAKVRTTADAVQLLERRFAERWQRRDEVTVNIRREAEKIAAETGLNADDIVAEAEAILAGTRK